MIEVKGEVKGTKLRYPRNMLRGSTILPNSDDSGWYLLNPIFADCLSKPRDNGSKNRDFTNKLKRINDGVVSSMVCWKIPGILLSDYRLKTYGGFLKWGYP
jgi:hypothetical protein